MKRDFLKLSAGNLNVEDSVGRGAPKLVKVAAWPLLTYSQAQEADMIPALRVLFFQGSSRKILLSTLLISLIILIVTCSLFYLCWKRILVSLHIIVTQLEHMTKSSMEAIRKSALGISRVWQKKTVENN